MKLTVCWQLRRRWLLERLLCCYETRRIVFSASLKLTMQKREGEEKNLEEDGSLSLFIHDRYLPVAPNFL